MSSPAAYAAPGSETSATLRTLGAVVSASSLSVRVTVAVAGLPTATPAGNASPNPSVTASPSSSTVSSTAVTVNVRAVSCASKSTCPGAV